MVAIVLILNGRSTKFNSLKVFLIPCSETLLFALAKKLYYIKNLGRLLYAILYFFLWNKSMKYALLHFVVAKVQCIKLSKGRGSNFEVFTDSEETFHFSYQFISIVVKLMKWA